MIIDVIDGSDPKLAENIPKWIKFRKSNSTIIVLPPMSNGVAEMVNQIQMKAQPASLYILRIWGHGRPGMIGVSGGPDESFTHFSGLSLSNIMLQKDVLESLNPLFSTSGRVELRGCNVGENDDGQAFVTILAEIWQVNISAGRILQSAGTTENLWSPPVLTVMPNGASLMSQGTPFE